MKTLHTLNILLISLAMFMGGCKKDSNTKKDTGQVNGLVAVETIIRIQYGQVDTIVYSYNYDAQGRVIYENHYYSMDPMLYTYDTNHVTTVINNITTVYTLNSQGLAVSDNQGYNYMYDNNGYLISQNSDNDQYVDSFIILNGNQSKDISISPSNPPYTHTYTYLSTPEYRNFGKAFLGKANANVISTETDGPNPTYTFNYTFDNKGRVHLQQLALGTDTLKYIFTYVN